MDGLVWFLDCDELIGIRQVCRRYMEGVHGSKARVSRFRSCQSLNSNDVPEPRSAAEVLLIKRLLQPLTIKDRLRNDLEVNKRAGQEYTVRLFEKLDSPFPVHAERSGGCDQDA